MPEPIDIHINWSANPPGQVGPRPRRVPLNSTVRFINDSPGIGRLVIDFKDHTPLNEGMSVEAGEANAPHSFIPRHSGLFRFKCRFKRTGGLDDLVLDPDDPNLPAGGGAMDVPPDGAGAE